MKIIVTAGGTGGHIYPALSIVDKAINNNDEVLYIGTTDRMESKIVPERGIKYKGIKINGLSKNIFKDFTNVFNTISSYKKVKKIIKEFKPDVVIGFGGYVTLPVLYAAHKLGIRTMIHEQNAIPGKTNKFLGGFVNKVFVTFKDSEKYFNKDKVIYSSCPTGEAAIKGKKHNKEELGFKRDKKLIIVVMGSLGSESVCLKLKDFLIGFNRKDSEVLFISGKNGYDIVKDLKVPDNVKIVEYYNNLSLLMKDSDIIISRAGASTITEILALKKLSILIPSPYVANNHQYFNAKSLEDNGLATMIEEKDLSVDSLNNKLDEILNKDLSNEIMSNLNNYEEVNGVDIIYNELKK